MEFQSSNGPNHYPSPLPLFMINWAIEIRFECGSANEIKIKTITFELSIVPGWSRLETIFDFTMKTNKKPIPCHAIYSHRQHLYDFYRWNKRCFCVSLSPFLRVFWNMVNRAQHTKCLAVTDGQPVEYCSRNGWTTRNNIFAWKRA